MKITVVMEHNPTMDSEEGKRAYPDGMINTVCSFITKDGHEVTPVPIGESGADNLTDAILENTDVLIWWGHWYHNAVSLELTEKVAVRVQRGMGLIVLHSGHESRIFKRLMGTPCTLHWREADECERLWLISPNHPIAEGVGDWIDVPKEEMYGEPFAIPTPDELVYIGWFKGGDVFRGGCVFNRGNGKIFYFNPGHETYPTYRIPEVQKVILNACRYVAPKAPLVERLYCPHTPEFSVKG